MKIRKLLILIVSLLCIHQAIAQDSPSRLEIIGGNMELEGVEIGKEIKVEYVGLNRGNDGSIESFRVNFSNIDKDTSFDLYFDEDLRYGRSIKFNSNGNEINNPASTSRSGSHIKRSGRLITVDPGGSYEYTLQVSDYLDDDYETVMSEYDVVSVGLHMYFPYYPGNSDLESDRYKHLGYIRASKYIQSVQTFTKGM